MKKWLISIALCLCILPGARADEGMWLIQSLDKALEKNMKARGLKMGAREIYNEEAGGLTDAIVSLGFYCSGSMISEDGLMITNHHCAYSDVSALSTADNNLLETGFFALSQAEEIPIPNKQFFFLRKVIDVSDEVEALQKEYKAKGKMLGGRKMASIMEDKYSEEYGMEAGFQGMWAGTKHYICLYDVYTDIRLVSVPPVSVASFGGDEDNWEWPQHKADFAIYRIYDKDGEPLHPRRHLKISTKGYKEGSYAMIIGYPGSTARYTPSAQMYQTIEVERPEVNRIRSRQMEIIRKWMDRDHDIRMKYNDTFFSLSNVAELHEGEYECVRRFGTIDKRRADEARMTEDKEILDQLNTYYTKNSKIELQKVIYRESLVRGLNVTRTLFRMGSAHDLNTQKSILAKGLEEIDPRVEKELLEVSVEEFLTHIDPEFLRPIHKYLLENFGKDYSAMASWLWDNSVFKNMGIKTNQEIVDEFDSDIDQDPISRYIKELGIAEFNEKEEGYGDINKFRKEYIQARYRLLKKEGKVQYPDANSTMRITYGNVAGIKPKDAVYCSWQSTAAGLREKYDETAFDYHYPDAFKAVLPPMDFPINFLTNLDITGGNSGSPVMNAKGELIGLAFDGNKESLASNYEAVDGYNMCVCVDIRYVLWILKNYAHQDYVLKELGI